MRVLLDTHALIWYLEDSPNLPSTIVEVIEEGSTEVYISSASFHEMAIKIAKGGFDLTQSLAEVWQMVVRAGFGYLPVLPEHADYLARRLPFHGRHKDPFDRIMIAQAIVENLVFISKDEHLPLYEAVLRYTWGKNSLDASTIKQLSQEREQTSNVPEIDYDSPDFWKVIDFVGYKETSDIISIPRYRRFFEELPLLLIRHGVGNIVFKSGGAVIYADDGGTVSGFDIHLDMLKSKLQQKAARTMGISNTIFHGRKASLEAVVNALMPEVFILMIRYGIDYMRSSSDWAHIGWLSDINIRSAFQVAHVQFGDMDTDKQHRLAMIHSVDLTT